MLETFWRGFEGGAAGEEGEMVRRGEEVEEVEERRRGEEGMKLLVGPRLPSPDQRRYLSPSSI